VRVDELDQEAWLLAKGTHKKDVILTVPVVRCFAHEIVGGNNYERVSERAQTMTQLDCLKTAT